MDKNKNLTSRQRQVLQTIYNSIKDSGYPPTLADLRQELEVSSNQAIIDFLEILEEKKFIKKEEGTARGLKILKNGFEALNVEPIAPYLGITAAGPYTQIFEDIQWKTIGDVEELDDILMKVKGDSMTGAGIDDGDVVIVRKAKEFKSGDIVLARNNDETTIKRFIHDDGKVYLKPENPKYNNIPIYPDTHLIGKVVKVLSRS